MKWLKDWLRPYLVRWFDVPVSLKIERIEINAEPATVMDVDAWRRMAVMFSLVPGLQDQLRIGAEEAKRIRRSLPSTPDTVGERIRLEAIEATYEHILDYPRIAVGEVNKLMTVVKPEPKPNLQNLN